MSTNGNAVNYIMAEHGHNRLFKLSPPPSLDAFKKLCSQKVTKQDYPLAADIKENVPVYNLSNFSTLTENQKSALQGEWYKILLYGPGVFVTAGLYTNLDVINKSTAAFNNIIKRESQGTKTTGDHFASAGKNDRIWNSFSKHGLQDPDSFFNYFRIPTSTSSSLHGLVQGIASLLKSTTSGLEGSLKYPRAMQVASQCLTLQGAIAHVDVPLESGPTRLLPFSQAFAPGYMAYHLPEFNEFFLDNYISLQLKKGDGLWFNPALFHAAGENKSVDINRLVNLVQISSAFGKPMETIDALPLVESTWDVLTAAYREQGLSDEVQMFIAAIGEGYPFPTNLDNNPPRNENMAPDSEQDIIRVALVNGKSREEVLADLEGFRLRVRA
ncbi:hypothetical protein QL093DRAFT_2102499 [Fusarium oxysporum]|nr:hypothetical protein QL093DRAFT_2102499 [Fusarium oxysporum]